MSRWLQSIIITIRYLIFFGHFLTINFDGNVFPFSFCWDIFYNARYRDNVLNGISKMSVQVQFLILYCVGVVCTGSGSCHVTSPLQARYPSREEAPLSPSQLAFLCKRSLQSGVFKSCNSEFVKGMT